MNETEDDFIPTSTLEDLLVARGYPQNVIDEMRQRRQAKEERLITEMD